MRNTDTKFLLTSFGPHLVICLQRIRSFSDLSGLVNFVGEPAECWMYCDVCLTSFCGVRPKYAIFILLSYYLTCLTSRSCQSQSFARGGWGKTLPGALDT